MPSTGPRCDAAGSAGRRARSRSYVLAGERANVDVVDRRGIAPQDLVDLLGRQVGEPDVDRMPRTVGFQARPVREVRFEHDVVDADCLDVSRVQLLEPVVHVDLPAKQVTGDEVALLWP